MPGLILLLTVCLSGLVVWTELMPVLAVLQPLPGTELLRMVERLLDVSKARLISSAPVIPYIVAAVIAGVIEGLYWRSKQIWGGYHRNLWQLALSPLVLALALLTSWLIALNDLSFFRLTVMCLLLIPAAFALTAGYKASTTR